MLLDLLETSVEGCIDFTLTNGCLKLGASILGLSYSISFPAAALTGAIALPVIRLICHACGFNSCNQLKFFTYLFLHHITVISILKIASLAALVNPIPTITLILFSILTAGAASKLSCVEIRD